jgi:cytochrome c oxidase subunit 4
MTVTPHKTYAAIWSSLLLLLLATYIVSRFDLGALNIIAALTIAVAKMLLVILFFMHVRHSTRLTWLFVIAGFVWLAIMIDLTLSDYSTRGKVPRTAQNPMTATESQPSTPKRVQNKP